MTKKASIRQNLKKKISFRTLKIIGLLLLITSVITPVSVFQGKEEADKKNKESPDDKMVATPYHIINAPSDSETLYAYELHRRKAAQDELPEFCAIIRQIDPVNDDYKTYCRLVVSDIIKAAGTDKLVVYIYDNNEAYELYETKFLWNYKNLDTSETDIVNKHFVATYVGNREGWDFAANNQFSYYENAHNGKAGHETYKPE